MSDFDRVGVILRCGGVSACGGGREEGSDCCDHVSMLSIDLLVEEWNERGAL